MCHLSSLHQANKACFAIKRNPGTSNHRNGNQSTMATHPFQPVFTGISEQIAIHGRYRSRDIALVEGERQVTWHEYNARANRMANALIAQGVRPGDRIATLLTNGIWAHELLLATWRAGAALVPLSPLLSEENLATMLSDCDPRVVFASDAYIDRCRNAANGRPTFGQDEFDAQAYAVPHANPPTLACSALDLAVIIYSSGTTGTPKGIAHSHESRLKFGAYFAAEFRFTPHARSLSCVPIHSNGAWLSWLPAKWMGATTIVLPQFNANDYLRIVEEHAPTHGFAVPTMAQALLAHPGIEKAGMHCFQSLITAGSAMPEAMKRELQRLTNHRLYELWGLTEGVATIMTPEDMRTRPASVGRPMLGCDIRLVDPEGHDVTGTSAGEIVGRSAAMMSGYWNRPDTNKDIQWQDTDGTTFIRTGDIGEFDAEGFMTLRGRIKDMIVSGGLNVYPIDIEMELLRHPAVMEASVTGTADEKWGEVPIAFVRLHPGPGIGQEALIQWVNARLAKHQRVAELYIMRNEFPRNSMGKVLKHELAGIRPQQEPRDA